MITTEKLKSCGELAELVERYGTERNALLPILQEIMERHHHISEAAMSEIAGLLNIHPAEVYGTATFYSFLKPEKTGRFKIRLCKTIVCDMQGKDKIADQLERDLGIRFGQTTADGIFSLEYANCLGACDEGPAMLVNFNLHTRLTPESVRDIIDDCRKKLDCCSSEEEA